MEAMQQRKGISWRAVDLWGNQRYYIERRRIDLALGAYGTKLVNWKRRMDMNMKLVIVLFIVAACFFIGGCAELGTLIPPAAPNANNLTNDEIVRGLKEALTVGAANSASSVSKPDGFYGNPQIFISFPPEAIRVKNTLEQAGLPGLVADFEKSMNRAAEEASKKSLPIFRNAIVSMTVADALGILKGPNNAATLYLKSRSETDLRAEFIPVVRSAIQTARVSSYWKPLASAYNKSTLLTGGSLVNPNLEDYITQKTLDGLFLLIAREEQEIRLNPAARVTDILKKVFSAR